MTHDAFNVPGRDKKRVERREKSFFIVPDVVRVSNRPRVDDFSDGSSISESTNDNPSIEKRETIDRSDVPLARARGAAEVLLRRERRGGGSGEGGHVRSFVYRSKVTTG
jgi:hypothetical protein